MTYGVPREVFEQIQAGAVTELAIVEPDYTPMMVEKDGIAFHEKEEATSPYEHIGFVPSLNVMHVHVTEKAPQPIPHPGGTVFHIKWTGRTEVRFRA